MSRAEITSYRVQGTKNGNCTFYKGSKVLAQIHTHPAYVDKAGNMLGGSSYQDRADKQAAKRLRAPVFSIGKDDISMTRGSRSKPLTKLYRESIMNNRGSWLISTVKALWGRTKWEY